MRPTAVLLALLCLVGQAHAQAPAPPDLPGRAEASRFQRTIAAALTFMEPRILEPVGVRQLVLWGLRGLTAIDPDLTVDAGETSVSLALYGRVVHKQAMPPPPPPDGVGSGAEGWAAFVQAVATVAANASEPIRSSGAAGVTQAFFDELFNHLDPYSRYVAPAAADVDRARRNGTASPGFALARRGAEWVVATVDPRGPAAEAGLEPGVRVAQIDGQDLRALSAAAVREMLDGPEGSVLTLLLRSGSGGREMEVERASIPPETVFASRNGNALVLRVTGFNRATEAGLGRELQKLAQRRPPPPQRGGGAHGSGYPRSLVLDLRGNRGGLLRQAVAAAALFVGQGIVASTSGRNRAANHIFSASEGGGGNLADGRPIIVLVDGRSASSAEILAAALADLRRAVVIGSSTLGKGLVQTVTTLPDGGELFITWSRVLAPGGWPVQSLGVLPQVCTSRGEDALANQLRALREGRQEMARAIAAHHAARAPLPSAVGVELRSACRAAEGSDLDMRAARYLTDNPAAYETALIGPYQAP